MSEEKAYEIRDPRSRFGLVWPVATVAILLERPIFSALAGWGAVPFKANGVGWLTVYICAPLLGGLLGGAIYRLCFQRAYAA